MTSYVLNLIIKFMMISFRKIFLLFFEDIEIKIMMEKKLIFINLNIFCWFVLKLEILKEC